jgi:ComF family protein
VCAACLAEFQGLDKPVEHRDGPLTEIVSLYRHEGRAAQAVRRLKYSRVTSLVDPVAELIRIGYETHGLDRYDLIVPVPIHWRRKASRGFNQAEMLASKLPAAKLSPKVLRRDRFTRPQVGLSREDRARNLKAAFLASLDVGGHSVLLVDDVTTSGHTGETCAIALMEKAAAEVGLLTLTKEV